MSTPSAGERVIGVLASPKTRLSILAVVLVVAAVLAITVGTPSKQGIEDAVNSAGVAAPLVYAAIYIGLTILLVPGALLTAAGGAVFGIAAATALTVVSATIAAWISFLIGRSVGREQVEKIAGRRLGALDTWIGRNGFLAVLYVRLIPLIPFNVLNYVAGVTAVRMRSYVLGTFVGIIPGTYAYTALGGSLSRPRSPEFISAVGLFVVLAGGAPIAQRIARRRGLAPDPEPNTDDGPEDPSADEAHAAGQPQT